MHLKSDFSEALFFAFVFCFLLIFSEKSFYNYAVLKITLINFIHLYQPLGYCVLKNILLQIDKYFFFQLKIDKNLFVVVSFYFVQIGILLVPPNLYTLKTQDCYFLYWKIVIL